MKIANIEMGVPLVAVLAALGLVALKVMFHEICHNDMVETTNQSSQFSSSILV
jgi:hypothetical protein